MIDLNNYRIDFVCCIDETIFLDIIDKRNGEVYSFYKNKYQDQNYKTPSKRKPIALALG